MSSALRSLPAVHRLLADPAISTATTRHGRDAVRAACRELLDELRQLAADDGVDARQLDERIASLPAAVCARLEAAARGAYRRLINATGVLLHTNLGRAPLGALDAVVADSYLSLEFDLDSGERGQRLAPIRDRIARVCGAGCAVMVNNNAAAVLLILNSLARDREVIVSRSQLIEIGGSFRLPSVMVASGSRLVEVGCTNRTHLGDYEGAISDRTAALLVAHQSNFRIVGFTTSPPLDELAQLAHRHGLPLVVDQGSGCLHDLRRWGLEHEETVAEILSAGADVVCFSGDKLLGGPQAGLVVGSRRWVEPLGRHPLYRALRPDKTALAAMDATLAAHASGQLDRIPLYAMLEQPLGTLQRRARTLGRRLRRRGVPVRGRSTRATLGGGTTPGQTMASYGLGLAGGQQLNSRLRATSTPVVARIEADEVVFDLRSVFASQDRQLEEAVVEAYSTLHTSHEGGR